MIQTIRYELLKIIGRRSFLIILAMLIIAVCGCTAFMPLGQYITDDCYNELRELVADKTQAEIEEDLEKAVLKYKVYDALTWGEINDELFSDNRTAKYVAEYKNSGLNSVEITGRLTLFQREYEQFCKVNKYAEFLESTQSNEVFSMFRDENSFAYKSQRLTEKAYKKMNGVQPVYVPSEGIKRTLNNTPIGIAVLIIAIIGAKKLFFDEKVTGISTLSVSYKNGRKTYAAAKLLALAVLIVISCLIFTFSVFTVNSIRFGFGDMFIPIQSVEGYYTSTLRTSVLGAILLSVLSKALAGICAALFVSLVSLILSSEQFLYLFAVLFVTINYGIYFFIDENSSLAFLKYASIFSLYDTVGIYGGAEMLKVLGTAVFPSIYSWSVCAALLLMFGFAVVFLYKKLCLHRIEKIGNSAEKRICVDLTLNELYRIFITRKGAVFAAVFAVLFSLYLGSMTRLLDLDDMQYNDYIREIGGKITSDTYKFIENEETRYKEINEQMNELSRRFSDGDISESDFNAVYSSYSKQLMGERSLQRVSAQLKTVGKNENAQLIYDTGYSKLLSQSAIPAIFGLIFAIILIPPIYGEDSGTGFYIVIASTKNGRKKLFIKRLVIAFLTAFIFTALCFFSQFLRIELLYGWVGLNAPVQSLMQLSDFPLNINIGGYFLLENIGGSLVVATISASVLCASKWCSD